MGKIIFSEDRLYAILLFMHVNTIRKIKTDNHIFSFFCETADKYPDHIIFKANGGNGNVYSYSDAKLITNQVARFLLMPQFADQAVIGILSENRPEWGLAYLSIAATGKTVVPIDANLKEQEIANIIKHAGLKSIFTSVRFESSLRKLCPDINVFSFNEASPYYWLKEVDGGSGTVESAIDPDDTVVLIYTSGTTGTPKAVQLTHRNLLSNLKAIHETFHFTSDDIFMSILPLHHTFEATCGFLTPIMGGCTIVYARSYKSNEIVEDIKNNKATIMIGVPLLFEKMYHAVTRKLKQAPTTKRLLVTLLYRISHVGWKTGNKWGKPIFNALREKAGLGTIRMFVSGGAAMPPHISKFFNLIGFDLFQGYGMTECSPVISANRPDDINFGSVGPPLLGVEVRIDDPDSSGVGEICVRGDITTPGYKNNPEETANLIRDGWLYTGDLGKIKHGHLYITGRKKNLIVSSAGKNIYPEEIEEKLLEDDLILESVVFGRRYKDKQGEEVRAIIVPDMEQFKVEHNIDMDNPDTDKIYSVVEQIVKITNSNIADYKRIKTFEIQLDELEKTSTKKVKRYLYN